MWFVWPIATRNNNYLLNDAAREKRGNSRQVSVMERIKGSAKNCRFNRT
jgi:hypothetical protein